jgi:hypothetical protein
VTTPEAPTISVRRAMTHEGVPCYIASGPDGHADLVARGTEADARRDGLAYFLATREWDGTRWVIAGLPKAAP